jgi:hypothetical protein
LKTSVGHRRPGTAIAVWIFASMMVTACDEITPTAIGDGDLPGEPITVEVIIPWSEFASNLEAFGGYGSVSEVGSGFLASAFAGVLDARTIVRFGGYPDSVTVVDSTGASRPDTDLTYIGGRVVVFFDSLAHTNTSPVTVRLGATQIEWDAESADWEHSFDTINDRRPWTQPGGDFVDLGSAIWDPAAGDSAVFPVDSAQIIAWSDSTDTSRGVVIQLTDPGEKMRLRGAILRVDTRPSIRPDTLVVVTAVNREVTFIYTPEVAAPTSGIRIGGAPAWRSVIDVSIPETLTGPSEFCALIPCPHQLESVQVSSAALVLTSSASDPAFQPIDSLGLDVRSVFDRAAMPKAPLGRSLLTDVTGRRVGPAAFGAGAGVTVEIPFTSLARDLLDGVDASGNPAPTSLVLLAILEPASIGFASFEGPGTAGEPYLRLVLTIGPSVQLP